MSDTKKKTSDKKFDFEPLGTKIIHLKLNMVNAYKQLVSTVTDEKSLKKLRDLQLVLESRFKDSSDVKMNLFDDNHGKIRLKLKLHVFDKPLRYVDLQGSNLSCSVRFGIWHDLEKNTAGISTKLDEVNRVL